MIKDLIKHQSNSKNVYFARQLTAALRAKGIDLSPIVVATEINKHYKTTLAKPHTVRKWLIGETQPKSETLILLSNWLKVDPKDLIAKPSKDTISSHKVSFEFDFTDQEVISKYLAMTIKEKITIRLVIDAISGKQR